MRSVPDNRISRHTLLSLVACLGFLLGGYHAHETVGLSANGDVSSGATECPACILGQAQGAEIAAPVVAETSDRATPLIVETRSRLEHSPVHFPRDWRGPPSVS
jgi:hypothetical protein